MTQDPTIGPKSPKRKDISWSFWILFAAACTYIYCSLKHQPPPDLIASIALGVVISHIVLQGIQSIRQGDKKSLKDGLVMLFMAVGLALMLLLQYFEH